MERTGEQVTVEMAKNLGLSAEEFGRIEEILNRIPNAAELSIFSLMWSERFSYKNSIYWLDTLPRTGKRLLTIEGSEKDSLIDLGDELACILKIKAHHPPTIDSHQNSSNGAHKIDPDILAMGARQLAALNSFYFGNINLEDSRHFVNTLSIGIVKEKETVSPIADGPGNPVFVAEIDQGSEEKQLQEAIKTGAILGMQYMGTAGITCSAAEMSAKSGSGMRLDLDKVPFSHSNKEASEILLADRSQWLMVIVEKGQEELLTQVFEKWNLKCVQIGAVTDTGYLEFYQQGELVAHVPAYHLVRGEGAPINQPGFEKPAFLKANKKFRLSKLPKPKDYLAVAKKIFSAPGMASKRWVHEQYSSTIHANSSESNVPSDAALISVEGTNKTLAITTNCNATYVFADPFIGSMIAVAGAARNIVCSGGEPLAITNCLHFGNPQNKAVYWQFVHSIKGIGEACRKFGTPVTGDKVNFYNQSEVEERTESIYPTPIIGMVGILEDINTQTTLGFKNEGDQIYMIGTPHNDIGSSEYLRIVHGIKHSPVPRFDLDEEFHIQQKLKTLIRKGIIRSAHDVSEGGLFVTLMESALVNNLGFDVELDTNFRKDAYLFGESQSRIVVSVEASDEDKLVRFLNSKNLPFTLLGQVEGNHAIIDQEDFGPIAEWKAVYDSKFGEEIETKEGQ